MEEVLALPAILQMGDIAPVLGRQQCLRSVLNERAAEDCARYRELHMLEFSEKPGPT